MTTQEALELLATKREAVDTAMNEIHKYRDESDTWIDSHKTAVISSVKTNAGIVGTDLSAWDGTK